jgi:hypothetical protein
MGAFGTSAAGGDGSERLNSTTVSGYHTRHEDGLMQVGHSKDHHPDLAQSKVDGSGGRTDRAMDCL